MPGRLWGDFGPSSDGTPHKSGTVKNRFWFRPSRVKGTRHCTQILVPETSGERRGGTSGVLRPSSTTWVHSWRGPRKRGVFLGTSSVPFLMVRVKCPLLRLRVSFRYCGGLGGLGDGTGGPPRVSYGAWRGIRVSGRLDSVAGKMFRPQVVWTLSPVKTGKGESSADELDGRDPPSPTPVFDSYLRGRLGGRRERSPGPGRVETGCRVGGGGSSTTKRWRVHLPGVWWVVGTPDHSLTRKLWVGILGSRPGKRIS